MEESFRFLKHQIVEQLSWKNLAVDCSLGESQSNSSIYSNFLDRKYIRHYSAMIVVIFNEPYLVWDSACQEDRDSL